MIELLKINEKDNVAVAILGIEKRKTVEVGKLVLQANQTIPAGHKIALCQIKKGEQIIKYGFSIGTASTDIARGDWVHTHNVLTNLTGDFNFTFDKQLCKPKTPQVASFMGYKRSDGQVGVRNEVWVVPTVGCVNGIAKLAIADVVAGGLPDGVDGVYVWEHPLGCSQMDDDHRNTQKLLASLAKNPNAAGVLIFGLGCENNTMEEFKAVLGEYNPERMRFLVAQQCDDEVEAASDLLRELLSFAAKAKREPVSVSELKIGLKCGGSDAFSGITANPVVGEVSDIVVSCGGSTLLTEIPEMFGAEQLLLNRCKDEKTFSDFLELVKDFRTYFVNNNEPVGENHSPGNKDGGLTTLEDKSLGCVQKGGTGEVCSALRYGQRLNTKGLSILEGPGNDIVAVTALAAAGCQIILFTTGRGTPLGSPVPVVKIASNSAISDKKKNWIDFNAGTVVEGTEVAEVGRELFDIVLETASGKYTQAEIKGLRQIAIWKNGVTL